MLRHDFRPGKLVAGLALLVTGIVYLGDAAGGWNIPWYVALPLVCGGLFLAATVAGIGYGLRQRRSGRRSGPHIPDNGG